VDNFIYENYGIYTMLNHSFLDDMVLPSITAGLKYRI
jgi:hypothetical protein